MSLNSLSNWLNKPVLLFDALGLSLFAVSGAQKALEYGHNNEVAMLAWNDYCYWWWRDARYFAESYSGDFGKRNLCLGSIVRCRRSGVGKLF